MNEKVYSSGLLYFVIHLYDAIYLQLVIQVQLSAVILTQINHDV